MTDDDVDRTVADRRPRLNPGLRRIWRDPHSLQLGLDPDRAVVIDNVDRHTAAMLTRLDGSHTTAELLLAAADAGADAGAFGGLLAALDSYGALVDASAESVVRAYDTAGAGSPPGAESDRRGEAWSATNRLAPDESSLALTRRDPAAVLAGRRAARMVVHGSDRVGVPAAAALAAAGVGHVYVAGEGTVSPGDCAPGGLLPADIHRPVREAASEAVRRANPQTDAGPAAPDELIDLVLLAGLAPVTTELRLGLHAARVTHLVAGVRETTAVVGPLVVPGRSSCLRCADLHRTDRDPTWPLVAAQLAERDRHQVPPCDHALALVTVALIVAQALGYLDGDAPGTLGGSLEVSTPIRRVRRRAWPAHPGCGCRSDGGTDGVPGTAGAGPRVPGFRLVGAPRESSTAPRARMAM